MENVIEWLIEARGEIIAGLVLALLGWLYSRYRSFMKMYRLKKKELERMENDMFRFGNTKKEIESLQEALKESEAQRQDVQNQLETLQQELQRKNKAEPEPQPEEQENQQEPEPQPDTEEYAAIMESMFAKLNELPEVSKYYYVGPVINRDRIVNILWLLLGGKYIEPNIKTKLACGLIAYVTNSNNVAVYDDISKVIMVSAILAIANKESNVDKVIAEYAKIIKEGIIETSSFAKSDIIHLMKEKSVNIDDIMALSNTTSAKDILTILMDCQQAVIRFVNSVQQNPFKW